MNYRLLSSCSKKKIDRFDCGNNELNSYFKFFAVEDVLHNISHIVVGYEKGKIVGYYSLVAGSVRRNTLAEFYPNVRYRYIPGILIRSLANDIFFRGQGYGKKLMINALKKIKNIAQKLGVALIIVDAKHEGVMNFYINKFGFMRISNTKKLVLPISVLNTLS